MNFLKNIQLSSYSNWKVGGQADLFIEVNSINELEEAINYVKGKNIPHLIIGNTTNLLFSDYGIRGALIKLGKGFSKVCFNDDSVIVGAGTYVPYLVRSCANANLSGIEHLIGVPASLGGAIFMNAGSQRKSISSNIISVTTKKDDGTISEYSKRDCHFQYRSSIFQQNNEVILSAQIKLEKSDSKIIRRECLEILKNRNIKFPRKLPSCGSVFLSDPIMYTNFGSPGKIIEDAGLRGTSIGGASYSKKHANFIVNNGGAKASDILELIKLAINIVYNNTGCVLKSEAKFVLSSCELVDADYAALNNLV